MKMWSGRFRQPLDPDFERWQRSFGFDRRLLKYELLASNAHARALKSGRNSVVRRTDRHFAGTATDRRQGGDPRHVSRRR